MKKGFLLLILLGGFMACTAQSEKKPDNFKVNKTEEEWKKELTPEQYRVLRQKGTERPGTNKYNHHNEQGVYACAACSYELFSSEHKYDSGSGWPAFDRPINKSAVFENTDLSYGMVRSEVLCSNCGGHLGHVFNDGPKETTGMRYCINSVSLNFKKK